MPRTLIGAKVKTKMVPALRRAAKLRALSFLDWETRKRVQDKRDRELRPKRKEQ
jgi:hypothetical protein